MYLFYEHMLWNVYLSSRELEISNFKKDVPERNFVA